jgi:8-oxo-dGTP diphosphatase
MTEDAPLYERDPEQWREYLAEGNRIQPRKRVVANVVVRDEDGQVLLVDPRYKPDWDLPGGMVEANEPPVNAAGREIAEELGIRITIGRLLVVDWVPPHDPWDDSLVFVFDADALSLKEQGRISLRDGELAGFQFCPPATAATLLRPYVWDRLKSALLALSSNATSYLHHGRTLDHPPNT